MFFYDDEFYDKASRRTCCVSLIEEKDWLCYKHPDGQWVTWRELTADDRVRLGIDLPPRGNHEESEKIK